MKTVGILIVATLLCLAGCQAESTPQVAVNTPIEPQITPEATATPPPKTKEVVLTFGEALNAADLDTALATFAPDAAVRFSAPFESTSIGTEEIRAWLEELIALDFLIEIEVLQEEAGQVTVQTTSWSDYSRAMGVAPLVAVEVYVMQDERIQELTVTLTDESLAKLQAAMLPPPSDVVLAFGEALNVADLEAALALFAPEAEVRFSAPFESISTGTEEIRAWLEELIALRFEIEIEVLEEGDEQVHVQTASWSDYSRALGVAPLVADEVYAVSDEKIQELTVTMTDASLTELEAALASQPEAILGAFLEAINAGDLETAMGLCHDMLYFEFDPLLMPGFESVSGGKDALRALLEDWMAQNLQLQAQDISEEYGTLTTETMIWSDYLEALGVAPLVVNDVIRLDDSQIGSWTRVVPAPSLNQLQEGLVAQGVPETIAPGPSEVVVSSAEDLVGTWEGYLTPDPNDRGYVEFDSNGNFRIYDGIDGAVGERARFWFDGPVLLVDTTAPNLYCDEGIGSYVVFKSGGNDGGSLMFYEILDMCMLRSAFFGEIPLEFQDE